MLDWISALLSAIGVYQNIRSQRSRQENVKDILTALQSADEVYKLLDEAKNIHDDFQEFHISHIVVFCKSVAEETDLRKKASDFDSFLAAANRTFFRRQIPEITVAKEEALNAVPADIAQRAKAIMDLLPEMIEGMAAFIDAIKKAKLLRESENYGMELKTTAKILESSATRTLSAADKVILNLCPILSFLQFSVKKAVQEIQ